MTRVLLFILLAQTSLAYQIVGNDFFISAGVGANVNSVRNEVVTYKTPSLQMPIFSRLDYALDESLSAFSFASLNFSGGGIGFSLKPGVKYFLPNFQTPLHPYVGGAVNLSFLFPTNANPSHTNLGLSPGIGLQYFVLADFLVGLHFDITPSLAFIKSSRKFELAAASYFDVTFRI